MKKINTCLLVAVTLQLSTSCFSQDSKTNHSNNIRVIQLVNPISILRTHSSTNAQPQSNNVVLPVDKKVKKENTPSKVNIDMLYLGNDSDLKKSANIAKQEEKTTASAIMANIASNSLNNYSDLELIKLVNYIKTLQSQNFFNNENAGVSGTNNTSDKSIADLTKQFSDSDMIKLATYIQNLENTIKLTQTALVKE